MVLLMEGENYLTRYKSSVGTPRALSLHNKELLVIVLNLSKAKWLVVLLNSPLNLVSVCRFY